MEVGLSAESRAHSQLLNRPGAIQNNHLGHLGLNNYNQAQSVINGEVGLKRSSWVTKLGCNQLGTQYLGEVCGGPQSKKDPSLAGRVSSNQSPQSDSIMGRSLPAGINSSLFAFLWNKIV